MGKTAADVEREIAAIRRETSWIVEELEYRVRRAMDLRAQAAAHPFLAGGTALALAGGLVFLVDRLIERRREAAAPAVHLSRRVTERIGGRQPQRHPPLR